MPLPLREILTAIIRDIDVAAVRADVNRSHWQRIYEENEILQEYSPSRIRIVEVNMSIPLALDNVSEARQRDYGITTKQIAKILPSRLSNVQRQNFAKAIHTQLTHKEQHFLLSKGLKQNISNVAIKIIPDFKPEELDLAQVDRFRQEYLSQPDKDQEAIFVFKASELEKLDSEHIIRIDLTLGID